MSASTAGTGDRIVIAGAGYAGLHVALRLTAKLRNNPAVELTLVDRYDYHQALTELPRVAAGTRAADAVRIPLQDVLAERVRFVKAEITDFDLPGRQVLTSAGPIGWSQVVLALGSRPNDFAIPGLAQRAMSLYSASDAERVWAAVNRALDEAAAAVDPERQRRLATVVVGGGLVSLDSCVATKSNPLAAIASAVTLVFAAATVNGEPGMLVTVPPSAVSMNRLEPCALTSRCPSGETASCGTRPERPPTLNRLSCPVV